MFNKKQEERHCIWNRVERGIDGKRGFNGKISGQKAGGDGLHTASEATALDFSSSMISHRKQFESFEEGSDM